MAKLCEICLREKGVGGWRYYDDNFRYLMQEHHSILTWDALQWELWLRAQHSPINKSQIGRALCPVSCTTKQLLNLFLMDFAGAITKATFVAVVP